MYWQILHGGIGCAHVLTSSSKNWQEEREGSYVPESVASVCFTTPHMPTNLLRKIPLFLEEVLQSLWHFRQLLETAHPQLNVVKIDLLRDSIHPHILIIVDICVKYEKNLLEKTVCYETHVMISAFLHPLNHETASSSAECSRDKPPFSFVRGQDLTMWDIIWVSPQGHRSVSVSCHFLLQAPRVSFSALAAFSRNALYNSTFYLLTFYLLARICGLAMMAGVWLMASLTAISAEVQEAVMH